MSASASTHQALELVLPPEPGLKDAEIPAARQPPTDR